MAYKNKSKQKAYFKEWRESNREDQNIKAKIRYDNRTPKQIEIKKEVDKKSRNKPEIKARQKIKSAKWRKDNRKSINTKAQIVRDNLTPAQRKKKSKLARIRNAKPEVKIMNAENNKKWYKKNKKRLSEKAKINNAKPEVKIKVAIKAKKWYKKNGAKKIIEHHILNTKEKLEYGNKCACCGLTDIFNLSKDHITPKSKRGSNKKNNMQLHCLACNTSKNKYKKCQLPHNNPEIKKMVTEAQHL